MPKMTYETLPELLEQCRAAVRQTFKMLLETKHLYQRLTVQFPSLTVFRSIPGHDKILDQGPTNMLRQKVVGQWLLANPGSGTPPSLPGDSLPGDSWFSIRPPDIRLFCDACGRVEAHNLDSATDMLESVRHVADGNVIFQVFAVSYLCQACKEVPIVFLIRREGPRLTLCGRSPMENVAVPSCIPKAVQRYYAGAIVAHQSGQTLAGLFMQRTLVEQWCKPFGKDGKTEAREVIEAYGETLPPDFTQRFPSLRDIYGRLSDDLHAAAGSSDLFDTVLGEIERHFEARRLYELDAPNVAIAQKPAATP